MGAVYNTEFTIKTKEGTEDKIFDRLNQFIEAEYHIEERNDE